MLGQFLSRQALPSLLYVLILRPYLFLRVGSEIDFLGRHDFVRIPAVIFGEDGEILLLLILEKIFNLGFSILTDITQEIFELLFINGIFIWLNFILLFQILNI